MKYSAKAKLLAVLFIIFSVVYFSYRVSLFKNLKLSLETDVENWLREFGLEKQISLFREKGKLTKHTNRYSLNMMSIEIWKIINIILYFEIIWLKHYIVCRVWQWPMIEKCIIWKQSTSIHSVYCIAIFKVAYYYIF